MRALLLTIAVTLALTACARRFDGGPTQPEAVITPAARQAQLDCDFEAEKASAGGRTMADRVGDKIYVFRACMRAKGY